MKKKTKAIKMKRITKSSMTKKRLGSNSCYLCKGKLVDTKEMITKRGKLFTLDVKQCSECGHSFSTLEESEKLRKEVNPSLLDRLKGFFSKDIEGLSIFKGRVL